MDHTAVGRKNDSARGKCILEETKPSIRATCWEKITRLKEGNGSFENFAASMATKNWSEESISKITF